MNYDSQQPSRPPLMLSGWGDCSDSPVGGLGWPARVGVESNRGAG